MAKARTGGGLSVRGLKEKIRDGGRRENESRRGLLYQGKLLGAVGWFTEAAGDAERERVRGRRARQRQVRLPSHFATPAPTRRRHLRLKPQESATHERRLREQGNGKQEAAGRSVAAQKKKEEHERRVRSKATNTKGEHETRRKDRGWKGRG